MIACEKVRTLADADVRTDCHPAVVVDPGAFPQPHIIADLKKPWVLYTDPRFADEPPTNSSPNKRRTCALIGDAKSPRITDWNSRPLIKYQAARHAKFRFPSMTGLAN